MTATRTSTENVVVERQGAAVRMLINRPPLNILDVMTLRKLRAKFQAASTEVGVRLVELRGAGEKAFSAGTEIRDHFPERAPEMLSEFHALVRAVLYSPLPTLAVVRGHCLGAGMELTLACDFTLASSDARFGQPEIKLGAFPPVAAAILPRLIPEKKALEIILTGESLSAEDAWGLGLVNRVVAASELETAVKDFSEVLLAHSGSALALARRATRLGSRQSLESSLREAERIYLDELILTEDAEEGLRAFLEKRPPRWGAGPRSPE